MPSDSSENYLKAVFHLQRDAARVTTTALAEHLGVTLPSATKMLKTLAAAGWIDHVPYGGARLTPRGEEQALRVIRKHRLIEVFLSETLGYDWDEVHEEAERLEHAVSDDLADRLDAFLGFPARDPHGDPIPSADGTLTRVDSPAVTDLPAGATAVVVRVLDQSADVLRYLGELGIRPGAEIRVAEVMPFDGPVRLVIDDRDAIIGRSIARRIQVTLPVP
jgi:DtxR family Mn-dependent transcriptional regulator